MTMNTIFKLVVCVFLSTAGYGQTANPAAAVLRKASEKYQDGSYYTYNAKYTMYADYTSNKIIEDYSGFLLKKDSVYYSKIKNTEQVGFGDYAVKVSKDEQAILIAKNHEQKDMLWGINSYLKDCNIVFTGNDKVYWICEITPSKITQVGFSKILIYINKLDYSVLKQKMYFLNETMNRSKATRPRLEVVYSARAKNIKTDNFLVDEKNYFTRTGADIKVANRFRGYKLYKV